MREGDKKKWRARKEKERGGQGRRKVRREEGQVGVAKDRVGMEGLKGKGGHRGRREWRGHIRREDQKRTGYNLGPNSEEAMLNFSIQLNPITPIRIHLGHKAECYTLFSKFVCP